MALKEKEGDTTPALAWHPPHLKRADDSVITLPGNPGAPARLHRSPITDAPAVCFDGILLIIAEFYLVDGFWFWRTADQLSGDEPATAMPVSASCGPINSLPGGC